MSFEDIYLVDKADLYSGQARLKDEYYDEMLSIKNVSHIEVLFLPLIQVHYNKIVTVDDLNQFKEYFFNKLKLFDQRIQSSHFVFTRFMPEYYIEYCYFY